MIKKIVLSVGIIVSLLLLYYVLIPSPGFPNQPGSSSQSDEPADIESPLRRAYFTNLTRQEVIAHYESEFNKGFVYSVRLNYPPEEARTIIRDQTRSTFLEEIAHPFRESLYINGFEPKDEKDAINIKGTPWRQKIIVRYVPSNVYVRGVVTFLTLALALLLVREYINVKK